MAAKTSFAPGKEGHPRFRTRVDVAIAILTFAVALQPLYCEQATKAGQPSKPVLSEYSSQKTGGPPAVELSPIPLSVAPPSQVVNLSTTGHTQLRLTSTPLAFEPNRGQESRNVKFAARGERDLVLVSGDGFAVRFGDRPQSEVKLSLVGGTPAQMEPVKQLPGVAHYYLGSDQKTWLTDIPMYAQVRAKSVYPGIDLVYYGNEGQLEYDFILQPGADPERIALSLSGPDSVSLDSEGNLGEFQLKHRVYQRLGQKCFRGDGTIRRAIVAGRSSYFCPACQPAPRKRRKRAR